MASAREYYQSSGGDALGTLSCMPKKRHIERRLLQGLEKHAGSNNYYGAFSFVSWNGEWEWKREIHGMAKNGWQINIKFAESASCKGSGEHGNGTETEHGNETETVLSVGPTPPSSLRSLVTRGCCMCTAGPAIAGTDWPPGDSGSWGRGLWWETSSSQNPKRVQYDVVYRCDDVVYRCDDPYPMLYHNHVSMISSVTLSVS